MNLYLKLPPQKMNLCLIHRFMIPVIASLLLTAVCVGGITPARAQDADQMQKFPRKLESKSEDERFRAISELSTINSEAASRLLLKQLKRNLASKRGYYVKYDSISVENGTLWTATQSENELLVTALGKRKYEPALQTFRKMLKMNEKWLGFGKQLVAENIYLFSPQPVKYVEDGDARVFPAPETNGGVIGLLMMPADGEKTWNEASLNYRLRELVRLLGQAGGPQGFGDPYFKTLKEDFGWAKLVSLVKGDDLLVRPYAVEALGLLGEQRDETLALLILASADKDPRVRLRSLKGLGRLLASGNNDNETASIVSTLTKVVRDSEPEVRYSAIAAIASYSNLAALKDLLPLLVSSLDDHDPAVRSAAAYALGAIGPLSDQVVPSLINLLGSRESDDRAAAVKSLTRLLQTNAYQQSRQREMMMREIARALLTAARDPAREVRYQVASSLEEASSTPDALRALIRFTRDPSRGVRTAAARALGSFETEHNRIASTLAAMLSVEDEDDEVIEYALRALGEMGPKARSIAPQVRKLLQSHRPRVREYAGYALEKIEANQGPKRDED